MQEQNYYNPNFCRKNLNFLCFLDSRMKPEYCVEFLNKPLAALQNKTFAYYMLRNELPLAEKFIEAELKTFMRQKRYKMV